MHTERARSTKAGRGLLYPAARSGVGPEEHPLSPTTTRLALWIATLVLALASIAAAFTVDTAGDGTDEQASGPTTSLPDSSLDTTPSTTPTTFVESSITTVPGATASTSPSMTGAGSSSPTTAAGAAETTPTTSGSGFSSTGPGAVADGTVPIAETGGLPFVVPGLGFLALASLLGLAARRAGVAYAEKS